MRYQPQPIDISSVELPPEIGLLLEKLARHNHDVWALGRIAEGWTWGATRHDKAKKHPDLVPYADLPESEKEYDRKTVIGTLKAIVALGYRLETE